MGLTTHTEGSANETELEDTVKDDPIIQEGTELSLKEMATLVTKKVDEAGGAATVAKLLDPPVSLRLIYHGMAGESRYKAATIRLFEFFFAKQLKGLKLEHVDKFVLKKNEEAKRPRRTEDAS